VKTIRENSFYELIIKNSKFIRMISYIMKIRVVLEFPTLPEGRGEIF